jgi:diphthine synthase
LFLKKEELYGTSLVIADRDMIETESDEILRDAHTQDVALLVVGDPFGATTHTDILLRARALGIPTRVIHNASIMNAVGACGLQLYNFGQTVSLVFFTDTWHPDSFYDRVRENVDLGMHTLILLDIKVKEQSEENLIRCIFTLRPVGRLVCVWKNCIKCCATGGERFMSHRGTCPFRKQWHNSPKSKMHVVKACSSRIRPWRLRSRALVVARIMNASWQEHWHNSENNRRMFSASHCTVS